MRTTMTNGNGHYERHIVRSDGEKMTIWYIGRCWCYATTDLDGNSFANEISGREIDADRIISRLRREFALGHIF